MSRSSNSGIGAMLAATLLAAPLSGCGPRAIGEPGRVTLLSAGETAVPVHSMLERRFETVVRQRYDFSCGSAALATLLRFHYGKPANEESVFLGMWQAGDQAQIRKLGFSLLDMKRYLATHGVSANGYQVSLDQIARTRIPGIALIEQQGYKHFVVVKGVEAGRVLVGDPARGLRLVGVDTFRHEWKGILFAIDGETTLARASFDRPAEWALAPMSPFTRAMTPVSLQSLALVRATPYPVQL